MVRDTLRLTQKMPEGSKLGLYLSWAKDQDFPSVSFHIA